MAEAEARAALARLIRERGEDYASLSRLIGRNPAYVQQYIKRGSPKRLDEQDRRLLARYFGVPETLLGAPDRRGADREAGGAESGEPAAVDQQRQSRISELARLRSEVSRRGRPRRL